MSSDWTWVGGPIGLFAGFALVAAAPVKYVSDCMNEGGDLPECTSEMVEYFTYQEPTSGQPADHNAPVIIPGLES